MAARQRVEPAVHRNCGQRASTTARHQPCHPDDQLPARQGRCQVDKPANGLAHMLEEVAQGHCYGIKGDEGKHSQLLELIMPWSLSTELEDAV